MPIAARNRACAPYLRNRELRPASGSPGEGETEAVFFKFHFCLIPLISEGITGPFMVEGGPLTRWTLPAEAARTARGGARRTDGATSGGMLFGWFDFVYLF